MNRKIRIIIFLLLSLLIIRFIFSNSRDTHEVSAQRSGTVTDRLKPFLDPRDRLSRGDLDHYVRKAAHFSEFAALGFSLMGLADALFEKKRKWRVPMTMLTSLVTATADEISQFFSEGRGPGITDVLIDFSGAVFGMLFMLLCLTAVMAFKAKAAAKT